MPNPKVRTLTIGGVTYDLQDNISGYITGITSSDVTTALGFTPYNATNPNGYTSNTGTITSVKTTAGTHTTINVSSGAANFNVPTKTSHLTNDSGFLTSYTETDPTVPSWAKASSKPSYNFSEIGNTPTTISGYGITNAYTKTEVDGLVSGVLHYKGTKANYAALPSSGNTTGDVWHLTDTGAEWAWDGSVWQELGTAIDLSGYATKATTLAGYGITDAKIQNGTITLGSNTITPLTSFTETDPTVPSWAKASSKPSYGLTEISGTDDLRAIEGLTGTSGLLKKTAANTWTLDTNTYLTSYTETDPVFSASAAAGITSTDISNWNNMIPITNGSMFINNDGNNNGFIVEYGETNIIQVTYNQTNQNNETHIHYVVTPVANGDAVNKKYVDDSIGAISIPTKTSDLTNDSNYITTQYIENKTDYEIPVSRVGEIVVGETAIGTNSTNFPTSKAVVDYVDERVVQEIDAIDVGVTGIKANGTSLSVVNGVVNIPAISPTQSVGLMTNEYMYEIFDRIDNVSDSIPTSTSQLTNNSNFTAKSTTTVTLTTTWSSKTQTISVTGVTASNTVIITPAPASYNAYCEYGVYCSAQSSGTLTFTCDEVPTSSLTVNVLILN